MTMVGKWIEAVTGPLEQKKQYRKDRARIDGLPEPHRTAARAMHRYLLHCSGVTDGDTLMAMVTDLADLWERASLDGTPVREIVGDDPVDFAESFAKAYGGREWMDKERARLTQAMDAAAGSDGSGS
jgi:DNA-binding ferritin-like protein (Dps family)